MCLLKQKHCMERSTCFTKVVDSFGWLAVLVVFLFFLLYNGQKTGRGDAVWDIFFLDKPLKFLVLSLRNSGQNKASTSFLEFL